MMKGMQTLVFHRVCPDEDWYASPYVVKQSTFRRQMSYLHRRGFYTPSLSSMVSGNTPGKEAGKTPFLLTLDDGYLDNYTQAFPILREFGFTATIFLVADFTRRFNWWDVPLGVPRAELLQRRHIEEMVKEGMEFGSHTMTHARLPDLREKDLWQELDRSKKVIEDVVQRPVVSFAYPYSASSSRVKAVVRDAGYGCAFAVNTGPMSIAADPLEIRRLNVDNATGEVGLMVKMNGTEKTLLWGWWKGKSFLQRRTRATDSIPT